MAELFSSKHGVIVACDVKTKDELNKLVKSTADVDGIVGYKVGFILGLKYGLRTVVKTVKKHTDLPVIYDHQKAGTDIPEMGLEFATICKDSGIEGVIIFPQSGPETETAFIKALKDTGLTPLVGGEMTHPRYLEKDGGFIRNNAPEEMYVNGAKSGAEFFIVPGNKPDQISNYARLLRGIIPQPKFCMPGIGRQGGDIESAFKATGGLPAYAIIGSAIYKSPDVRKSAEDFGRMALGIS